MTMGLDLKEAAELAALPNMRDELDRKAVEAVERLVRHHEQGKIGFEALVIGARTVWEVVSGLASDTTTDLAEKVCKEVGDTRQMLIRAFRDIETGEFVCSVMWTPGKLRVSVLKRAGQVEAYVFDTEADAKARFSLLGDKLASRFEEWN